MFLIFSAFFGCNLNFLCSKRKLYKCKRVKIFLNYLYINTQSSWRTNTHSYVRIAQTFKVILNVCCISNNSNDGLFLLYCWELWAYVAHVCALYINTCTYLLTRYTAKNQIRIALCRTRILDLVDLRPRFVLSSFLKLG